jgi:tRNA dimethylallyltransferase
VTDNICPVLIIGGPTASGKSGLALGLAERLSGTVINADSMQVYEGLPLLTAQPSAADQVKIPHRLYAALPPTDTCSAARWRDMALSEIRQAHDSGRIPVVTGGTGFYLKTLLEGLSPIPDVPHALREKAAGLQKELGNPRFHQELQKRDPVMAAKLHPFNTQRLVRAWEVLEATGKSLSEWQSLPPVPSPPHLKFMTVFLSPPRKILYAACDARFEKMLEVGALEEVKNFRQKFPGDTSLSKSLGYPELSSYMDGKMTRAAAAERAKTSTRHYAKRQVTWFRHQIASDFVLETPDAQKVLDAFPDIALSG